MSGDDFRFTKELTRVDASKLDRAEKRDIEGLYRTKEYLGDELRHRLSEIEGERDLLRTQVDRLQTERSTLRERLDALERDRGTVAPDRVVSSIGDALASARDDLSDVDYAVGRIEVDLKANVVGGDDGIALQLPDLSEPIASGALSTLRFDLRPAARTAEAADYEPIPDVRDRSLEEARDAIRRAGFSVGEVTTQPGDTDGSVFDQFPSPRSVAEPGTAIDLTVSERREVDVPAVVGHALDEAAAALDAVDLAVGEVDAETHDELADVIVGQSPPAGETVPVGTRIDLTVSAGPTADDANEGETGGTDTDADADDGDGDGDADDGADADTDSDTDGPNLQAVDGIGPTYADRLREAGITDLPTLLAHDPGEIAAITRASPGRAETWFEHAEHLLEGE